MQDDSQYLVLYPDETRGYGVGPSSFIPTFGAATSALDQYRTVQIASTNLPQLGGAFTDVNAVVALSRIAEGGFTSALELEAAETGLQALLLHDIAHVLIPAPKYDMGNGFISYIRHDKNSRTQLGFELFSLAHSRDWLVAPEFLKVTNQQITESSLIGSPLIGQELNAIRAGKEYSHEAVTEAINVAVEMHGVPAYFTNPALVHSRRGDGFSKRFYHQLRVSWDKAVGDIPPIICTFSLPPFLAIVLHRLNNRSDLKSAIAELREELSPVRRELRDLNAMVTESTLSSDIERRVRYITESFDAIIPESRMSGAARWQRRILSIQRLSRPIVKFAMGFASKGGASLEDGVGAVGGARDLVIESRAVIDRTLTASVFAGLIKTESLQSLVKHHFSEAEIMAIERSLRRDSN